MSVAALIRVSVAYRWRHGRWPDLDQPRRFTEWVQWRKLNDRDAALAKLTDKSIAKRTAAELLDPSFIIPTLWRGRKLPELPPAPLPLIVKANHGCNQFVVVNTPDDWQRARRISPRWLSSPYGRWLDEWHYGAARRDIIVEPFVAEAGQLPLDYKIYVFGGRAEMVQVHHGRGSAHRWTQWGRDWQPLSANARDVDPPRSLEQMLDAAERLAGDRDFLRVDFYEIDGQPKFGEFALFPGSGLDPFNPVSLDQRLGALWAAQHPCRALAPRPAHVAPASSILGLPQ